jgi:leucyl/phenylalanyl-tRNA--protein transferase
MTGALTPKRLLAAYAAGVFPMAETRESTEIHWVDPRRRGIFALEQFHVSRSLARAIRRGGFAITIDTDFDGVVRGCADRPETWINDEIFRLYGQLHQMGHAHSLEVRAEGRLVGGVYGVTLGAAFFGESMFSRVTNGSKIALAFLCHRLRAAGFQLFDTQFLTPHLASLGAIEASRGEYHRMLRAALSQTAQFDPPSYQPSLSVVAGSVVASAGASAPSS